MKLKNLVFISCFFLLILISFGFLIAGNSGAIIVSGSSDKYSENDIDFMESVLTNTTYGYAVPPNNIIKEHNITWSDFKGAIEEMNNQGISELHLYLTTHGEESGLFQFNNDIVETNAIVNAVQSSDALTIHIIVDACYSGLLYNGLKSLIGTNGTIITSADENHVSLWDRNILLLEI